MCMYEYCVHVFMCFGVADEAIQRSSVTIRTRSLRLTEHPERWFDLFWCLYVVFFTLLHVHVICFWVRVSVLLSALSAGLWRGL